jgi:hypothetical protein
LKPLLERVVSLELASISLFVFIIVIIFLIFRREIQLDRIKANNFKPGLTLFAVKNLSFVHVLVDMDFRFTFRTNC